MQIDNIELTEEHIGSWVDYWPGNETGRIKSFTTRYVFVVYHCAGEWDNFADYTAASTHSKSLHFCKPPKEKS